MFTDAGKVRNIAALRSFSIAVGCEGRDAIRNGRWARWRGHVDDDRVADHRLSLPSFSKGHADDLAPGNVGSARPCRAVVRHRRRCAGNLGRQSWLEPHFGNLRTPLRCVAMGRNRRTRHRHHRNLRQHASRRRRRTAARMALVRGWSSERLLAMGVNAPRLPPMIVERHCLRRLRRSAHHLQLHRQMIPGIGCSPINHLAGRAAHHQQSESSIRRRVEGGGRRRLGASG